jgi:hypothetical protein
MQALRSSLLAAISMTVVIGDCHAAIVNFSAGGSPITVVFETTGGTELVGATLFAGTFSSPPALGSTSIEDVLSNFLLFDTYETSSGSGGNFPAGQFSGTVGSTFASAKIYLVVADSSSLPSATQSVFSSTNSTWIFPGNDGEGTPSSISLPGNVDQYYAGLPDSIENPGTVTGMRNSIQMAAIPEPQGLLLLALASLMALRRSRAA